MESTIIENEMLDELAEFVGLRAHVAEITGRSIRKVLARVLPGAPPPVEAFKRHGADFIVERTLSRLVARMNEMTGEARIDPVALEREIAARSVSPSLTAASDCISWAIRTMISPR